MIDKQFEWNIDGVQANTVLEGAEVNIPIEKYLYSYIFCDDFVTINSRRFDILIDNTFKCVNCTLNNLISHEIKFSYLTRDNKHYIGFDYNTIFNNILEKLKMDRNVRIKQITNEDEYNELIKEIKNEIGAQFLLDSRSDNKKWDRYELTIIGILYKKVDKLVRNMLSFEAEVNKRIESQIGEERELRKNKKALSRIKYKCVEWKNLMYYTACKALNIYEETKDKRYYKYAKNYYLNISRDEKAEYPVSMFVDGEWMDYHYNSFNSKFLKIQNDYFSSLEVRLGIEDIDTIDNASLTEGIKKTNNTGKTGSKKRKIDYSKITEGQHRKIKFYNGLKGKVTGILKGYIESDLDYIGFVLDNNYVIYDKFYEVSKDGKTVKIAYDNAVYVVTLDVAVACHFDKGEIRDYIKKNHDYKAFRLYHNDTDSYQRRINEVLEYSDVSTIKFKDLKLLNEKRD